MKRLAETDQLENRLESLGGSIRKQYLLEGLMRLAGIALLALVGLFILDYITHMPFFVRVFLLLGGLAYGVYWFWKNFYKKYQRKLSTEEVGLIVERTNPNLQSRMISTLQFQATNNIKEGVSENLVEGMVNQTFNMIKDVKWSNAIDKRWVKNTMKVFGIGCVLFILASSVSSSSFLVFFERFVSSEARYPTKTKIVDVSFENVNKGSTLRVPEGQKISVKVTVDGEIPAFGKISIEADSGSEAVYDLKIEEGKNIFNGEIDPLLESIKITINLGDAEWGPKSILVIPRPKIQSVIATITPPKYTKLEVKTENSGNLQVQEGSAIDFIIKSDKDLARLSYTDFSNPDVKIDFKPQDPRTWVGKISGVTQNVKYTFQLVDKEELVSRDIPIYTISVINDKAPNIKILKPILSIERSPVSKVVVILQIVDDFLISEYAILAQIVERNEIGEEIPKGKPRIIWEERNLSRKSVEYTGKWDLGNIKDIKLAPGNRIKMWVEAKDNHEPSPLLMKSQEVFVTIISEEELRNKLMERTGLISKDVGELIIGLESTNRDIEDLNK
jgi:hypothetical protein